ncbi:MAG: protein translocase subunit SecD [Holophagaceae bacterium]
MKKRTIWRVITTALVCLGSAYFFWPLSKVKLGLDLRGGVHFVLEVESEEALKFDLKDTRDRLMQEMLTNRIPGVVTIENGYLAISNIGPEQTEALQKILKSRISGYDLKSGGAGFQLTQTDTHKLGLIQDANTRALEVIEKRIRDIDPANVLEPEITASGVDGRRIVVEIPGIEEGDRERVKALLSTPGRLEQRLLAKNDLVFFPSREEAEKHFQGKIPAEFELFPDIQTDDVTPSSKSASGEPPIRRWVLLESKTGLDGADIIGANRSPDQFGKNEVHFILNQKGADDFAALTGIAAQENRQLAIVLDGKVVSILGAREKIIGGSVSISRGGGFPTQEAEDLASQLRSGALRAPMKFLDSTVVGPGLGLDSIRSGVKASLLGFAAIVLFMVVFYHWSGVNAIVALVVNMIVMMGLLGSFKATLTLPGIAGFALTLGMAVDANILIIERIKEELRLGRSVKASIDAGFDRVFWTIVDSHVTQLAAALLLLNFGTGPVKGFAVTLIVGVAASLFTSIYISRFIYDWILDRDANPKSLSVGTHTFFQKTSFDFMKYKGVALLVSWGVILATLIVARPWAPQNNPHIQLGMQFVGGNDMTVRFKGDMKPETLRSQLVSRGFPDAKVVSYETTQPNVQDFSVKVKASEKGDLKDNSAQAAALKTVFRDIDPDNSSTLPSLNLEGTQNLTERIAEENLLNYPGDLKERSGKYQEIANLIINSRNQQSTRMFNSFNDLPGNLPPQIRQSIEKNYRLGGVTILKDESFSPSISGEWTRKTLQAIMWASVAILVYVMFRFTSSYAVAGIVALFHDLLMALGLFTLFKYEFNVAVVASFLTLMGYSMADTIVVFDRIRENSHKPEYRLSSVTQLVNDSINQTLSRTILTSFTVFFVSACLWLFGGPALHNLAFPMMIGVITGTYSSIFIASPILVYWERWFPPQEKLKQTEP